MDPGASDPRDTASAIDAELEFHFAEVVEALMERGWSEADAREEAQRRFGDRIRYREDLARLGRQTQTWRGFMNDGVAASRNLLRFDGLVQDARYALRTLARSPAFSSVALLALALGIGATTAVFSVVNAVLLRPLPFAEPDRLVMVFNNTQRGAACVADFLDWRARSKSFESLDAFEVNPFTNNRFTWTGDGAEPEKVVGYRVTAGLLRTLGVQPILGRTFEAGEDDPGRPLTVVLSERLWRRRYGSSRDVLGRHVMANGRDHTIVGVLPGSFEFWDRDTEIWAIRPLDPPTRRGPFLVRGVARLKPGASIEQAAAEMSVIATDIERAHPGDYHQLRILVPSLREVVVGNIRPLLWVLSGAVGLVLLIAVSNVANLTLGRASGRAQEIAVRLSIGATRSQLVRQLMIESTVLALIGGVLGTALAVGSVNVLRAIGPADLPRLAEISVSWPVLGFTLLASVLSAILFGLVPSIMASGWEPGRSLKEGGRGGESRQRGRARAVLVAGQVTLSIVLLIGAGLLIRSFNLLGSVDAGFSVSPDRVVLMLVSPTGPRFREPGALHAYWLRLVEQVQAVPGVEYAALSTVTPPDRSNFGDNYDIEAKPLPQGSARRGTNTMPFVSAGFLETLGIPLRRGRWFTDQDAPRGAPVAVINESLARRDFPGGNPIGQRIRYGRSLEIVGVVGDVKYRGLDRPNEPAFYQLASQQAELWDLWLLVRMNRDAQAPIDAVRDAVRAVDPSVPVDRIGTMADAMSQSVSLSRFRSLLMTAFAATAVLLAAIGIYGVVSYAVAKRTKEIGMRMALGATPTGVVTMIVSHASKPVVAGIAVGVSAAFLLARVLQTMLFGVTSSDPLTLVSSVALLSIVAIVACLVPALRASRIDPLVALRSE
jgi:putative ABC transport system permease protein